MAALATPWQPTGRTLRQLGWVLAGAMALAGHCLAPSPTALGLQLGGASVFAVSTVRPSALRPIYLIFLVVLWPLIWLGRRRRRENCVS